MFNRHAFLSFFITALFAATAIVSPEADAVSPAQTGDQHGTAEPEDDTTHKRVIRDDVEPGDPCEDLDYAVADEHMGECSVNYRAYVVGLSVSPHITSQPYQRSFGCRVYFETENGKRFISDVSTWVEEPQNVENACTALSAAFVTRSLVYLKLIKLPHHQAKIYSMRFVAEGTDLNIDSNDYAW